MRTALASPERLTTRTKPWRPNASEAEGNSGTECVAPVPSSSDPVWSGTVDRFVKCPVGLHSRLITSMGCAAITRSRHLPLPVPNAPVNPSPPDSSSRAVSVRAVPGASVNATGPCDDAPSSSIPSMRTSAGSAPGLTTRRRLAWLTLRPGLNVTTRCPASVDGATSCIAVRNPSLVRM